MPEGRRDRWLAALLIVAAGAVVYANSLRGPFVFDDLLSIVESPNLRRLWPLTESCAGPAGSGASGRPLVAFSLALNYAYGELDVFGYHLVNVLAHLATALVLAAFARCLFERTSLADWSSGLGTAVALLWVVHPLNTDALNLVVTRSEVLLALFTLTTLFAAARAFAADRPGPWTWICVLACAASMASKEIAVSAPLLVLAYDRSFHSTSLREALRRRPKLYGGLAATWVVLGLSVASGDRGASVGFGGELSALDYLRTQAVALPHYLGLSFLPRGLSADYSGWPPVRSWGPALLPGALVVALVAASGWALFRRRPEGFAGLLFFALLAPSSSLIPLGGEWIAEHRMYLPLVVPVGLVVGWSAVGLRKSLPGRAGPVGALLVVAAAVPLALATAARNEVWSSARGLWEDVLAKDPSNGRAHDHLAALLMQEGQLELALEHAEEALRLDPGIESGGFNAGVICMQLGRPAPAVEHFERALGVLPESAPLYGNLGVVLYQLERTEEALEHLRRAVGLDPDYVVARRNLALVLVEAGRSREALPHLKRALALESDPRTLSATAWILCSDPAPELRDGAEALRMARALLAGAPRDPDWLDLEAAALAEQGRFEEARLSAGRALERAREQSRSGLAERIARRLELYRRDTPYRTSTQ